MSCDESFQNVLIVIDNGDCLSLELHDSDGFHLKNLEQKKLGVFQNVEMNETATLIVVIFDRVAVLIDVVAQGEIKRIWRNSGRFLRGTFAEGSMIHFSVLEDIGAATDWCIWDYQKGELLEFELERNCHYGRGAVLHPSKLLVGICWSAYASGFVLHSLENDDHQLPYFDFGEDRCFRLEYESRAPSFNQSGDKIAFLSDQYIHIMGDDEILCVYDIEIQNNPVQEILVGHTSEGITHRSFFVEALNYVLLQNENSVKLVDLKNGKVKILFEGKVQGMAVSNLTGSVIISQKKKVFIARPSEERFSNPVNFKAKAKTVAENFLLKHQSKQLKVKKSDVSFYVDHYSHDKFPILVVQRDYENGFYRLDTGACIFSNMSESTSVEVKHWLNENQKFEYAYWQTIEPKHEQEIEQKKNLRSFLKKIFYRS